MSNNPDFLIIGAAKSGTTAIWHWLNSHPDVFLPSVKEPSFFSFQDKEVIPKKGPFDPSYSRLITTKTSDYRALFQPEKGQISGEASPIYLQTSGAAQRIYKYNPNIKLIAILRDPAKRAFSQFSHNLREGYETTHSFNKALGLEKKRRNEGWLKFFDYLEGGRYGEQLNGFYKYFNRKQILVLEYEALRDNPLAAYENICQFLGIPCALNTSLTEKYNISSSLKSAPRIQVLKRMSNQPNLLKTVFKSVLPKSIRELVKTKLEALNKKNTEQMSAVEKKRIYDELADDRVLLSRLTTMSFPAWGE